MNLSEINWPVFRLSENKPETDTVSGLVYYFTEYADLESNVEKRNIRIVDDTSIQHKSLSRRRLALKGLDARLHPINSAIYFLADLIKIAKATTWFIDSSGKLFQYKKAVSAKLTCHKVLKVLPGQGMGAIVELEGIATRFKTMFHPQEHLRYAGVLKWGMSNILYGFYEEPFKPSRRRV